MTDKLQPQFTEILDLIRTAQNYVIATSNQELIKLYWSIGKYISERLKTTEWGQKAIEQLAAFIQTQEPGIKGFEKRNLERMRQFYETYPEIASALRTQLNWTHHRIIMSRCKTEAERLFYIQLTATERYTTRELERQINSGIFERTLLADAKLPVANQSQPQKLAGVFRDSYILDFLNLPPSHSENDLKTSLILCLKDFILELGRDFSFMGQEYRLQVGNTDFFIDLLFYHRELQSLVAFELKIDKFKPEHLGQLEFYLEALDRDVKKTHENPSIGVLLCRDKDDEVIEYALSRSLSPTIVAEYEIKLIPKETLRRKLNEFYELLAAKEDISQH
ncbi:PDDEXK nuclease domain-containing protein [Chamaesiphon polymorphus]|uniref:PDDEXK nuclease domain-containing protein n=1 Tax=Chamaesiphon polymorphus TaxID=2107691 RepID=UPI0015E6E0C4|nr:PDDEXK nuclease domain-containing protein [Chamaesiphon polymorphus]